VSAVDISGPAVARASTGVLRRALRLGVTTILWAVGGFVLGLALAITVPYMFGNKSLTVLSGSMEPTLHVGDVVIVHEISPLTARVGDIVTFRDPADATRLITHRVRSIQAVGNTVRFVTKGDANTSVENWKISGDGKIGLVQYRIPRIGYALSWIRGKLGRLMLVVFPALALGAWEINRIWRPRPDEDEGEDARTDEEDTDADPA
jgi:signal peptidase